eukprot:COSAG06_NODE_790_length_12278_cov_52.245176_7_plen_217_part_00
MQAGAGTQVPPPPQAPCRCRCPLRCTQTQRTLLAQHHLRTARREQQAGLHAPQRPQPRVTRQPLRRTTAARTAATTTTTTGHRRRYQPQPRALLDRRQQLRAARLRERGLREAPRDAGEPPELPQAEEAADEGEGLVRELVVAQRQRRISGRRRVVVVCRRWRWGGRRLFRLRLAIGGGAHGQHLRPSHRTATQERQSQSRPVGRGKSCPCCGYSS